MDCVDYKGYKVYDDGTVLNKNGKKIIPSISERGYATMGIWDKGKRKLALIHRLVAECFIPNPEHKKQVNHINGIKTDNRVENLEWVTPSENIQHALNTGLINKHGNAAKLTDAEAQYIRIIHNSGITKRPYSKFARLFGVHRDTISNVVRQKFYKEELKKA